MSLVLLFFDVVVAGIVDDIGVVGIVVLVDGVVDIGVGVVVVDVVVGFVLLRF